MVAARLDMVADPALRGERRCGVRRLAGRLASKIGISGVQPGDSIGHCGDTIGQFEQLEAGDSGVREHRIGEDFRQLVGPRPFRAVRREALQVDVIGLGEPQQDRGRNRPLVALDMVEIGGGDSDFRRHRALVQAQLEPQPPDPPAKIQLSPAHCCQSVNILQASQVVS